MNPEIERVVTELNLELRTAYYEDSKLFSELLTIQSKLGLLYGDRPTCPFLRPFFLSRRQYDEIALAAEAIGSIAEKVTAAALEDHSLLDYLGLTDVERELALIDPGYSVTSVTSRLDTFIDGRSFKFLEYNAETPAGVGDQMQLERVLEHVPVTAEFLHNNSHWTPAPHKALLRALFESYRETGGTKAKPTIAIVDWEGVSTGPEFETLSDYFESMGFPTIIVTPDDLDYDGTRVFAGTLEIDIVYKRVLIAEFLEKYGGSHPLLSAYRDGNICLANGFRCKIPHKKSFFALLSSGSHSHLFSEAEIEVIEKHIPWTRVLGDEPVAHAGGESNLLELIRAEREAYLIKPTDDYGGKGIVLGWETNESEWDDAIESALGENFVVQRRAPIEKQEVAVFDKTVSIEALLVDFDPFLFRNRAEGGMVRLSNDSLVNVTQGGGQTALVVLEDV
ncbi:MAG: hypothetical protein R2684_17215 [Pyrinomonadaceae bacterium]